MEERRFGSTVAGYTGAGILPYCWKDGTLWILLHKTLQGKKEGTFVDFGGWKEPNESDPLQTAAREFSEETGGLLTTSNPEEDGDIISGLDSETLQKCEVVRRQTLRALHFLQSSQYDCLTAKSGYHMYVLEFPPISVEFVNKVFSTMKKKREFFLIGVDDFLSNRIPLYSRILAVEGLNQTIQRIQHFK